MRIVFASRAFVYVSLPHPAEPRWCTSKHVRRVVLHHQERISAACTFLAHGLSVRSIPPVKHLTVVDRLAVEMILSVIRRLTYCSTAPHAGCLDIVLVLVLVLLHLFDLAAAH